PEGNSTYVAPAGAAQQAVDSSVRQGVLEASNINPVLGTVSMMALQRHTEMLQRALSIFHTEFNRTAAVDLPRV
ncbi:MAG: flagellar biosynthesis protein FlgG, partial [Acidobacteria bacterium]|nr:flagellar biosynthesis protein FlgG [Acidobacteriota bacterium]